MPSALIAPGAGELDVVVTDPRGSPNQPVGGGVGDITPPVGWIGGDGAYCEWRSRAIVFSTRFTDATGAFQPNGVPLFRLGWHLSIYELAKAGVIPALALPRVSFSTSFGGGIAPGFGVSSPFDPPYGPVIKLLNTTDVQARIFLIHLDLPDLKDEDRSHSGSV